MIQFDTVFVFVLGAFFIIVMIEGIRSFRRTAGDTDFLIAGRRVGPWIGGASLAATQMSAGTFVGTIAVHYLTGASFIWGWTGIWLAYIVGGLWVAPKMRRYSQEHGGLTFPDFIGDRYSSRGARGVAAILIVLAYIVFMSAQYQAGGVILETIFGIPFVWGAVILMVLVVLYTVIGGMVAVMRTDFLQQIAMALGALIGLPLLINYAGGASNLRAVLTDVAPSFLSWHFGFRDLLGFALAFGLTFVVAPYILVRFYAMRDDKTIRKAVGIAILFNVIIASSVAMIGMSLKALYPQLSVADAASTVFASEVLPPFIGALVMTAVIAAVMSTVDSVLLVAGPAISHDIYYRLVDPEADVRKRLRINRLATLVVGAVPILLTLRQLDIVQFVVLAFAALLASTVFIPVVVGLYWRGASAAGAITSMVVGFVTCLIWYLIGEPFINPVVPGVLASGIAMYAVSRVTQPVGEAGLRPFFADTGRPARVG
ncbi:MAG: sodium/proline symporter [Actinomycetota bacterium]